MEIDEDVVGLNFVDQSNIINTLSSRIVDSWMGAIVDDVGANEELVLSMVRKAIATDQMNYLLTEAPKEVCLEIGKTIAKYANLFLAQDIKTLLSDIELLTVRDSVNYLMTWMDEKEIKYGLGDFDFSYEDLSGKSHKITIQYVILYEPINSEMGRVSVRFYSNKALSPPKSEGSLASAWGTSWNYTAEHEKGEKIPPFVLSITGKMKREKTGYWKEDIIHRYTWIGEPKIEVEFLDGVPYFEFEEKGFFEKIGDKFTDLLNKAKKNFKKAKDLFNEFKGLFGASVVRPDINKQKMIDEIAQDLSKFFKEIGGEIPEQEFKEIEHEIENIETEEDLEKVLEKIEQLRIQMGLLAELIAKFEELKQESEIIEEVEPVCAIINEVCAGYGNSKNEFIELYNPNSQDLDLSDFKLELVNSSNNSSNKQITWINTVIPADSYFLLVGGEIIYKGEALSPDATFSSQLTSISGVILRNNQDYICDMVSYGKKDKEPPALAIETRGKLLSRGLQTGYSLERLRHEDTNNNWEDFYHITQPSPVNSLGDEFEYENITYTSASSGGSNSQTQDYTSVCSDAGSSNPAYSPIIINEVAWMGSRESYTDEWIELRNITDQDVSLERWELLINDTSIVFGDNTIPANSYFLLERTDDNSVPNITADYIYRGSLNNSDVDMKLFNSSCEIIDRVIASPDWPAGDNDSKRTMERQDNITWHDYCGNGENNIFGTPRAINSKYQDQGEQEEQEDEDQESIITESSGLLVTEVRATGNYEFVELYNPTEDSINTQGLYLAYYSPGREWNNPFLQAEFPEHEIEPGEYYVIGFGDFDSTYSWRPYQSHLNDGTGAIGIFSCDISLKETQEAVLGCKIDVLGWGESLVKEENTIANGENSLSRVISVDGNGYLNYQDTDDNSIDFENQESTPWEMSNHSYSDLDRDNIIDSMDPETIIQEDITLSAGEYILNDLIIQEYVVVTALSDTSLEEFMGVKLIANNIVLNNSAHLSADATGYSSGEGPGVSINNSFGSSHGGLGGREEDSDKVYDSIAYPVELGSSGAMIDTRSGGSGGGALILEVSGILLNNGIISVNGEQGMENFGWGYPATPGGSGGSIYISANTLSGVGLFQSNGGGTESSAGAGGGGRISLNYTEDEFTGLIQAYGGNNPDQIGYDGGPGSIYVNGSLTFDNNNFEGKTVWSHDLILEDVDILNNSTVYVFNNIGANSLNLSDSSLELLDDININISKDINLVRSTITSVALKILGITGQDISLEDSTITANTQIQANHLSIDVNSLITSRALGYASRTGPGAGINTIGGGYGGYGGRHYDGAGYGEIYGDENGPQDFGSGGGDTSWYGSPILGPNGGGKHQITIISSLILDGEINSNGGDGKSSNPTTSAGSGGSVNITTGYLSGLGNIFADGGSSYSSSGAGGGGRIKISGDKTDFIGLIQASGGINHDNPNYGGGDGSIKW